MKSLFGCRTGSHLAVRDFQLIYGRREFDSFFKFTIVRNPWDRLVSSFLFLKSGGYGPEDQSWAQQHLAAFASFDHFVRQWVTPESIDSYIHFVPQHRFLGGGDGPTNVDFVGRFETLGTDFADICNRVGIKAELQRLNRTSASHESYVDLYTEETARIVAEVYSEDIRLFGYRFDA